MRRETLPTIERAASEMGLRAEEFSPVKNASGADSLETAQRDMVRRAARWLEAAGLTVPRRADGEPNAVIEIAPSFALCAEDVLPRARQIAPPPPGGRLYLEYPPQRSGSPGVVRGAMSRAERLLD